jgi:site-specific DNA recombinase
MKNFDDQNQLRVALYLRVSTDDQVEKYGIDLQKTSLEGLLQSKGKLVDGRARMILAGDKHVYIDDGISGTTELDERPAFAQLKEDLLVAGDGQKPFDVVAVYKIDRFARRLKILLDVVEFFEERDVQFLSASESIDTSTPFGKAMLGFLGIIAELEIETTKARTQAGRAEAIKNGVIMGANAIYGYTKDADKRLSVFEEEAKFVRLIFGKFVNEKLSAQQVADYLTKQEVLSPEASALEFKKRKGDTRKKNSIFFWRSERVREILANEAYIGKYYHGKTRNNKPVPKEEWVLSPYQHPSIIDFYLFKQAQTLLAQSKQLANTINKTAGGHVYLLSGLLKCDCCRRTDKENEDLATWVGDRKKLDKKGDAPTYTYAYKCGRKNIKKNERICKAIPIPAEPLEKYVVEMTRQLLSNPIAVYKYQQTLKSSRLEIKKLQEKREQVKGLLNNLPNRRQRLQEQHENGYIDLKTLKSKNSELAIKEQELKVILEKTEHQIAQNSLSAGYINTLKLFAHQYIKALDDVYKNRSEIFDILHMLVSSITVYSRPVTKKDKIAGRKKEDQLIPYKLEMELKLPQDILNHFASQFGVKTADL